MVFERRETKEMDSPALHRFRATLDSVKAAVSERIVHKRGAAALGKLALRVRHMNHAAGHEAAVRQLGHDAALLLRVEAALHRIRRGTYGTCLLCHKPIGLSHLRAVPWAAFCSQCRTAVDSHEAVSTRLDGPRL